MLAAAGSGKTESLIQRALAQRDRRVLITTYTNDNLGQLTSRLAAAAGGTVPENIKIFTWYALLLAEWVRPYQAATLNKVNFVRSLNFLGDHARGVPRASPFRYYCDGNGDVYRNNVSEFAYYTNEASNGAVIRRLEARFDCILIDEFQDLAGYDLELIRLLFDSKIAVTAFGDPRQVTYLTNNSPKNRQYRGAAIVDWVRMQSKSCVLDDSLMISYRCSQEICDFADSIFPSYHRTTSLSSLANPHYGIITISRAEAVDYYMQHSPKVLRHSKVEDSCGLPAMNFGASKGLTFDHVMIFTTGPMRTFLKDRDASRLRDPSRFYVAVTRARFSVAFVV